MALTRNRQEESVVGEYSVRGDYKDQVTQSAVTPWTVTEDMTRLAPSLESSPILLSGVKEEFSSFVRILEIYIIIGIWNGRLLIQSTRPEVGNKGRPELTPLTWWTGG